jgi:hypothetical protein
MKCSICDQDMQAGRMRVDQSHPGTKKPFLSWLLVLLSGGKRCHLVFLPQNEIQGDMVVREGQTFLAFRCPSCRTVVIPGQLPPV